jgi:hypothetical protein
MEVSPHILDIIKHFSIDESKLYNIVIDTPSLYIYIKFTRQLPDKIKKLGINLLGRNYHIINQPYTIYVRPLIRIHSSDIIRLVYCLGEMYYIGDNSVYCSGYNNNGDPDNIVYNLTSAADMVLLKYIQDNLQCFSCENLITIKKINNTLHVDGYYKINIGNIHHTCS